MGPQQVLPLQIRVDQGIMATVYLSHACIIERTQDFQAQIYDLARQTDNIVWYKATNMTHQQKVKLTTEVIIFLTTYS